MLFWIVLILIYLPIKIMFPTRVIGRKNLPKGKAIYAPNHQTNCDIMIIACGIFRRMFALGKAELYKTKFDNWFLNGIGCIKVQRGQADIEAVKNVLTVLKKKQKPVVIFPTGTRNSSPEEIENLKSGVAMFSVKAQAPIVPMVLIKRPKLFRFNKLVIGEPLDLTKYEGRPANKELYTEIVEDLQQAMEKLIADNTKKRRKKCQNQS